MNPSASVFIHLNLLQANTAVQAYVLYTCAFKLKRVIYTNVWLNHVQMLEGMVPPYLDQIAILDTTAEQIKYLCINMVLKPMYISLFST